MSFVQGFRLRAWLASVVFLITMPLVFFIIYKILFFFELQEVTEWTVGWNLFAVAGAIVQQVFHWPSLVPGGGICEHTKLHLEHKKCHLVHKKLGAREI